MLDTQTFLHQKIAVVFVRPGDKAGISNQNVVVTGTGGEVRIRIPCRQLFVLFLVGNISISTALIHQARKFRFCIVLLDPSFRETETIGVHHQGNSKIRRLQYTCPTFEVARHLIVNKVANQKELLIHQRDKSPGVLNAIRLLEECEYHLAESRTLDDIRGNEGTASQVYFRNHFNNLKWHARKPREKNDPINTMLDLGYSLLFVFIESLLSIYDFDLYCGVLHADAPKRKSLVCDIMEPFRPIIDKTIKDALNLRQFTTNDFSLYNGQWRLNSGKSAHYLSVLFAPLIEQKDVLFQYMLYYYRAFVSQKDISQYPIFALFPQSDTNGPLLAANALEKKLLPPQPSCSLSASLGEEEKC